MAIEINLSGAKIYENASVLNGAVIHEDSDVHIDLSSSEISGQSKVLDNLEINSLLNMLEDKSTFMDKSSNEYMEIQRILKVKNWDKKEFITCIKKHLAEFSQGVLASIIANLLT